MKVQVLEKKLSDGSPVFDVDIFVNGRDKLTGERKCIFSCTSEKAARAFLDGLQKLVEQHTVETMEVR